MKNSLKMIICIVASVFFIMLGIIGSELSCNFLLLIAGVGGIISEVMMIYYGFKHLGDLL
jgi:hypothetical protein